jgi:hypothetical protein
MDLFRALPFSAVLLTGLSAAVCAAEGAQGLVGACGDKIQMDANAAKSPAPVPDARMGNARMVQASLAPNTVKPVAAKIDVATAETNTGSQDNWEKI